MDNKNIEIIVRALGHIKTWWRVVEETKRRTQGNIQEVEERILELEKAIEGQYEGSTWELAQTKPDKELIADMRDVLAECEKQEAFLKGCYQGMLEYEHVCLDLSILENISNLCMAFDFTGLYDIHNKPIRNGDIVRRIDQCGDVIGEGEVKHGVYECSYCDEYRCDHYGWYIDFAINTGYIKTNTGYPLFIGHNCDHEKKRDYRQCAR